MTLSHATLSQDDLVNALTFADVVYACTSSEVPIVDANTLYLIMQRRKDMDSSR